MTWITGNPPPDPDETPGDDPGETRGDTPPAAAPEPAREASPFGRSASERALPTPPTGSIPPVPAGAAVDEPPIDPLEDTSPSLASMPAVQAAAPVAAHVDPEGIPMWRRLVGLLLLLAAASLTFIAGLIVFVPLLQAGVTEQAQQETPAPVVTEIQPTQPQPSPTVQQADGGAAAVAGGMALFDLPALSQEQMDALLSAPVADLNPDDLAIPRDDTPFTIVPERPRGEVITYTVQEGDTITEIAEVFDLEMDTIAWSNNYQTVFALRPGNELYIMPVDGVYHQVLVSESIQAVADQYGVDPYTIINSEYNNLFGMTPDMTLPSGTRVVVPGGTSDSVNWIYNPVVQRTGGSGGTASNGYISFAPGQPGSCGSQPNPGGTGYFTVPLRSYTWVRGFTTYHTGVDLSAGTGTPVYAASAGRVIYAGWNNWGYGYLVVVAHGPFTTLYGHLSGISAGCGQMVDSGTIIGQVGSTGNSSGPHLHYEVRYNDIATDPLLYTAF